MKIRQFRVVSLVLTALSAGGVAATVAMASPAQAAVEISAAETCLIGADFKALTYTQLYDMLAAVVGDSAAVPYSQIVTEVGQALARSSGNCSPQELGALIKNVAIILEDLGVDANGRNINYLVAAIEPIRRIDVAEVDVVSTGTSIY